MKKTTKQNERYEWNDVDNDDDNDDDSDDNDGDDERQQWNSCFARFMNVFFYYKVLRQKGLFMSDSSFFGLY